MTPVVFTDLDGTLLDHATYSHAAAAPALDALRAARIPVVLCSSKTAAEIAPLHAALSLAPAPYVVENGAGIVWPGSTLADTGSYARIRAAIAAMGAPFRGFGDMTDAEVSDNTGLSMQDAALARQRRFSEPGVWQGDPADLPAFLEAVSKRGLVAKQGGRFLTLSEGGDKATAMKTVTDRLGSDWVIALGDAPNDAAMIQAANLGIVVANPHGPGIPPFADEAHIKRTTLPGPAGWNAAILDFLKTPAGAPR